MSGLDDLVRRVRRHAWSRPDFLVEFKVVRWSPLDRHAPLFRDAAEAFEKKATEATLAKLLDTAEVAILDLRSRFTDGTMDAAFEVEKAKLDAHRDELDDAPRGWAFIREWAEQGAPPELVELAETRQKISEDFEAVTPLRLRVKDGPEYLTAGEIVPAAVTEIRGVRAELLGLKAGAAAA
jgi:hypothetical protein